MPEVSTVAFLATDTPARRVLWQLAGLLSLTPIHDRDRMQETCL